MNAMMGNTPTAPTDKADRLAQKRTSKKWSTIQTGSLQDEASVACTGIPVSFAESLGADAAEQPGMWSVREVFRSISKTRPLSVVLCEQREKEDRRQAEDRAFEGARILATGEREDQARQATRLAEDREKADSREREDRRQSACISKTSKVLSC
ncbi:hypothetical protein RvY_14667-1 [Ramazzottius varieornatus]|uniref:Uncharacterized protein n=1 Tax=Ramazzottius varieornatus TaxID=947166 RepID=A0A1D1VTR7_RAMVA|nr:hypothetical protein RvY_14667-1 [Ramazzottius varieornatus]